MKQLRRKQIQRLPAWARRTYKVLGTDGFGRSDFLGPSCASTSRSTRHYIVSRGAEGAGRRGQRAGGEAWLEAIAKYAIDADKINPLYA